MQTALRWCFNGVYLTLIACALPILVYRRWTQGKYRDGWQEKLWGQVPRRTGEAPCLWLHAVSVGEVLQLQPIVEGWQSEHADWQIVITTTTRTGREVAEKHYPQCTICYCPLDFTWAVRAAFDRIRPTCLGLIELELWPNLILEASQRQVKTVLLNGRLSARSFRGYRKIRPLVRTLFQAFELVAVQNEEYAERFRQLGVRSEQLLVAGSLKFDRLLTDRNTFNSNELRRLFCIRSTAPVLMGGSTHAPEEELLLTLWQTLWRERPELQFLLAPRHAERFEEVAQLAVSHGFTVIRRSEAQVSAERLRESDRPQLLLLDTLGELSYCWALADLAYVGGSLNQRGGQNMMEPAAFGTAVFFGPNTWNFADVVKELKQREACCEVADSEELGICVREFLHQPHKAQEMGLRAQEYVMSQQGGTVQTLTALSKILAGNSPKKMSRAA